MAAFIRYPKEATTCLSRSLWSLACTGSRAFGIAAFCRLWVNHSLAHWQSIQPTRLTLQAAALKREQHGPGPAFVDFVLIGAFGIGLLPGGTSHCEPDGAGHLDPLLAQSGHGQAAAWPLLLTTLLEWERERLLWR
jgi:hypothetical protein